MTWIMELIRAWVTKSFSFDSQQHILHKKFWRQM